MGTAGDRAPESGGPKMFMLGIQQEVSTSELCAQRHRAIIGEGGGDFRAWMCVWGGREGGRDFEIMDAYYFKICLL